jgi:4-hydroxy-tetrahydrodipicolinate reductase
MTATAGGPLRVALWGTGNVGRQALRGILDHPGLDLVAVIVHDPAKAGADAGALCDVEPIGLAATCDPAAAIGGVDVLCYTATAERRGHAAVAEMATALRAGVDVASTSHGALVYPEAAPASLLDPLNQACAAGRSTFLTSGLDPGYMNDLLPLSLSACSRRIESLRTTEVFDYSTYAQPEFLFDILGFGKPLGEVPLLLRPGILTKVWGPVLQLTAKGLGVELEEIAERYERAAIYHAFTVGDAEIKPGTAAALRFELTGRYGGQDLLTIEHVTRVHPDAAPDWPRSSWRGCYRVQVTGEPNLTCEVGLASDDENGEWLLVTAMRVVNAIPAVHQAPPGVVSVLDLPLFAGRGIGAQLAGRS